MNAIIYEYCEASNICVLRQDNYSSGLDKFMDMFEIAKKDFPGLEPEDTKIERYGGDRHKYQFGLEFKPKNVVPERYERIHRLELTG